MGVDGRSGFRPSNAEWREMISAAVEAAMAEKDGGALAQQARPLTKTTSPGFSLLALSHPLMLTRQPTSRNLAINSLTSFAMPNCE